MQARQPAGISSYGPPRHTLSRNGMHHSAADGFQQSPAVNKNPSGGSMNKIAVLPTPSHDHQVAQGHFTPKQIDILKNSICRGVSNEEFEVFLMACVKTQLDPFMKQIYAVKRKMRKPDGSWGESMTIQTGIDGYRLIAERTGRYAPGCEPSYVYDENGVLLSSTAYIKKMTPDGTWHDVSASAYMDEYCQKTKDGHPIGMWATMPRTMLAKCAESQALRKAFPAEMSGVYTKEEMAQAECAVIEKSVEIEKVSEKQSQELEAILDQCDGKYREWFFEYLKKQYATTFLCELPADIYPRMKEAATKNMNETLAKKNAVSSDEMIEEVQ